MRRLAHWRHDDTHGLRLEQALEGLYGSLRKLDDSDMTGADGGAGQLQLEANLGFGRPRIISSFAKTQPQRNRRAMTLGQRRLTQFAQESQRGLRPAQALELKQVDHERHVPHEPSTRLVEIHVDAQVLWSRVKMEKKVGAAGGLPVPATFELMAGGLLEAGQLPSGRQHTFLHGLDERLERKNGIRGGIRHDRLTPFCKAG